VSFALCSDNHAFISVAPSAQAKAMSASAAMTTCENQRASIVMGVTRSGLMLGDSRR
jgi:hypothetical protein